MLALVALPAVWLPQACAPLAAARGPTKRTDPNAGKPWRFGLSAEETPDDKIDDDQNGTDNYLPGYVGATPKLTGNSTWKDAQFTPQALKLVANDLPEGVTKVEFRIHTISDEDGYCMNASAPTGTGPDDGDFSFSATEELTTVEAPVADHRAVVPFLVDTGTDGMSLRLYYVLDSLSTTYQAVETLADATAYGTANRDAWVGPNRGDFVHLQLACTLGEAGGVASGTRLAFWAVDSNVHAASWYAIPLQAYHKAHLPRTAPHAHVPVATVRSARRGRGAMRMTRAGTVPDVTSKTGSACCSTTMQATKPIWPPFNTTLAQPVTAGATSIEVTNASGLTPHGVVRIRSDAGYEDIHYDSVVGDTLTGLTRGLWMTAAADHAAGDGVEIQISAEEHRVSKYGHGTRGQAHIR